MSYVMCGNISVLYNMVFMHRGNTYFNLFKTPIFFEHLQNYGMSNIAMKHFCTCAMGRFSSKAI